MREYRRHAWQWERACKFVPDRCNVARNKAPVFVGPIAQKQTIRAKFFLALFLGLKRASSSLTEVDSLTTNELGEGGLF